MAGSSSFTVEYNGVARSMWVFIAFTVFQIVCFIFRPTLFAAAAGDMDKDPWIAFRLIGCKEIGLMVLYTTFVLQQDCDLIWLTAIGRLAVAPFLVWLIIFQGAPISVLGGIVQDVAFGLWTAYALSKMPAEKAARRPELPANTSASMLRGVLAVVGSVEAASGIMMMFKPAGVLGNQPQWASPLRIVDHSIAPLHLGLRSFGLMTCILGCYQICIARKGASLATYLACGVYHPLFALSVGGVQLIAARTTTEAGMPLDIGIVLPKLHMYGGPPLLMLSILVVLQTGVAKLSTTTSDDKKK